jgi:hypothetical protein
VWTLKCTFSTNGQTGRSGEYSGRSKEDDPEEFFLKKGRRILRKFLPRLLHPRPLRHCRCSPATPPQSHPLAPPPRAAALFAPLEPISSYSSTPSTRAGAGHQLLSIAACSSTGRGTGSQKYVHGMELIGGGARSGVGKARRRSGSSILTIQASSRSFFFL